MAAIVISIAMAFLGGIAVVPVTITTVEPVRSYFLEIEAPEPLDVVQEAPDGWLVDRHYKDGRLRLIGLTAPVSGAQPVTSAQVRLYLPAEADTPIRVTSYDLRDADNQSIEAEVEHGALRVWPWGDLDCDGQLSIVDLVLFLQVLNGQRALLGCG